MAFEKWWAENGTNSSRWLEALGTLEAISSFASLVYDNPSWSFPEFVDDDRVVAVGLGHPLIPETKRVDNDVNVGPEGVILWYILEEVLEHVNLEVAVGPWRLHNLGQASTSEETAHARK